MQSKISVVPLQGPRLKPFLCSIRLSMKFQMLIKTNVLKISAFLALEHSAVVFIMLINV